MAPAGTPPAILEQFHAALKKAASQPKMQSWMADVAGMELAAGSADEFGKYITSELERWRKVIVDNNIKLE